jgi:hypothetical protein
LAALLRRRDFAWINRRVGVVTEEGTAFRRPFFFACRERRRQKSRAAPSTIAAAAVEAS